MKAVLFIIGLGSVEKKSANIIHTKGAQMCLVEIYKVRQGSVIIKECD